MHRSRNQHDLIIVSQCRRFSLSYLAHLFSCISRLVEGSHKAAFLENCHHFFWLWHIFPSKNLVKNHRHFMTSFSLLIVIGLNDAEKIIMPCSCAINRLQPRSRIECFLKTFIVIFSLTILTGTIQRLTLCSLRNVECYACSLCISNRSSILGSSNHVPS